MKKRIIFTSAITLLTSTFAVADASDVVKPNWSMTLSQGNYQFGVNLVAYLGKAKLDKKKGTYSQVGPTVPARLENCEAGFYRTYQVKDKGQQYRAYPLEVEGVNIISQFPKMALPATEFEAHTRNGNSAGKVKIYNQNTGHINFKTLASVLPLAVANADAMADSDFPQGASGDSNVNWFGSTKGNSDISFTVKCHWKNFLPEDVGLTGKKGISVVIDNIDGLAMEHILGTGSETY
ncbi:hypothetical protein [Vibrio owensii]|uniref:hypothetical protein n=1 Tax=Vibrio owensii TaxID=696485 RepID=UPI0005972659|nr:hypothetical protein [Vibrio owensii]